MGRVGRNERDALHVVEGGKLGVDQDVEVADEVGKVGETFGALEEGGRFFG